MSHFECSPSNGSADIKFAAGPSRTQQCSSSFTPLLQNGADLSRASFDGLAHLGRVASSGHEASPSMSPPIGDARQRRKRSKQGIKIKRNRKITSCLGCRERKQKVRSRARGDLDQLLVTSADTCRAPGCTVRSYASSVPEMRRGWPQMRLRGSRDYDTRRWR